MKHYHASLAVFLLAFAPAINAKPNAMKVKNCNNNGRKCSVDAADFKLDRPKGDISQIDLGNGRNFACKSSGPPEARGATFHAECISSQKGNGNVKVKGGGGGAMNAIKRGTKVFASLNTGTEICQIQTDTDTDDLISDCTPNNEFPDEVDDEGPVFLGQFPQDGEDTFRKLVTDPVDRRKERSDVSLRGRSGGSHHRDRNLVDDLGGNIDTMVVWTAGSECRKSRMSEGCTLTTDTEETMRGMIDLAIAETNDAFKDSGIDTQLRLVHAYRDDSYTEPATGVTMDALTKIAQTSDGHMDDVHAKRDTYGADIVAMIVNDLVGCGVGYQGPFEAYMFSVTSWRCATGRYSFGSSIAANMGANPDRGKMGTCSSSDYNYGYRDPQARFRSIMAWSCRTDQCDNIQDIDCPRVQRFSNPTHPYDGEPIGIADQADNARRINDVRAEVAAYRTFMSDCQVDSDCDDNDACTTHVCDGACVLEPIDCDDGNVCTADSCSRGSCVHEDISCDDGNSCTVDTCDASGGGCSHTIIPNCCGNSICEADEDTSTCFEDCSLGPFTISTPYCGSSGCYAMNGNMFDVEAKSSDISITSLKIRLYTAAVVEVWTKPGTYVGSDRNSTGWIKIAEHDLSNADAHYLKEIPESSFTQTVHIPAGFKQAFYITTVFGGTVLFHQGDGSVTEDDVMRISEGTANAYPFEGKAAGTYMWNGEIIYEKDGNDLENLARGANAVASQSSTDHGGVASRAIDGNTDGNWGGNSVTHTNNEGHAWLKVDLGQSHDNFIHRISIYNRVDCCMDRIINVDVQILDNDGTIIANKLIQEVSSVYHLDFDNVPGRYVRLYKNVYGSLGIAEVKVKGLTLTKSPSTIAPTTSHAPSLMPTYIYFIAAENAFQSSTYPGGVASRAIDGNTDGNWGGNSVMHTNNEEHAWLKVDLGQSHDNFIHRISIYNRVDCCMEGIINVDVQILDNDGTIIANKLIQEVSSVYHLDFDNVPGRYVRLYKNVYGSLAIAEVKVKGLTLTKSPSIHPTMHPTISQNPSPSMPLINLALVAGAAAHQSSVCMGSHASRAIDGNTDGNWMNGSVQHTCNEANPWWVVDLGADGQHFINSVSVYNREDCCMDRLYNSDIQILDNLGNTLASQTIAAGNTKAVYKLNFEDVEGRYVRFQKNGGGTHELNIAEVQVMGWTLAVM